MRLAVRAWSRYVVPFTLLSLLAYAPLIVAARRLGATSLDQARTLTFVTWIFGGAGIVLVLGVVGAVAPTVRSLASGSSPSQLAAFTAGLRGLVTAIVPVGAAIFLLLLGLGALVVPGLFLAPLVALTGASPERGLAARLADAAAVGRAHWRSVALALVAIVAVAVVILVAAELAAHLPLPKKAAPALIAGIRLFPRRAITLLALLAPLGASALAAIHVTSPRR